MQMAATGTVIKLLLLPSYVSTDFEVHRGWMAITANLPISQWYVDATSEWTLDYPPFFAWFEWCLSFGAPFFDRKMLVVSALPYTSAGTIAYQRLTVIACDLLLLLGACALASSSNPAGNGQSTHRLVAATRPVAAPRQVAASVALTFLNAGLLIVDHVHFQYNGMLIGVLLLSCAALATGRDRWSAVGFAVLLNLKHLFLFAAPLFFLQLLRGHVLQQRAPSSAALKRLVALGGLVVAVFALSLGPFTAQLSQLGARLFPFGRGLTHAYWAPNFWALYTFADRLGAAVASRILPRLGLDPRLLGMSATAAAGGSSGRVGETAMLLLPSVGAAATAVLVLAAQVPLLIATWRRPRASAFAPAVACCGLAAYCFGYHVHEKALLPPLLVLTSLNPPPRDSRASGLHARLLVLLSSAGHFALLPLLHEPAEWALARLLPLTYLFALLLVLSTRLGAAASDSPSHASSSPPPSLLGFLRPWEALYLFGFVPLDAFCSLLHPLLLAPRMPFMPLMATSVYCALGVLYASGLAYQLWWEHSCGRAGVAGMDSQERAPSTCEAAAIHGTDIEVLNVRSQRMEVSSVVGRAFAGTAKADPERSFDWVLGPQLPVGDPRRVEFLTMFMVVPVLQHGHPRRGIVLATRDAQSKVDAVVVARRFDSAPGADRWASSTAIVTMMAGAMLPCYDGALPTIYADSKMRAQIGGAMNKRAFDGLLPKMEEMHKEWADMPHWYVAIMAVDPSAQGKGRCGTLMRAVSRMADAEGVPCYLECSGTRNRDIYAHLGYEQKRQYTVCVKDDETGSVPFEEVFAMVRPAATHAVEQ